ncbi:UNVERIFIED_CONTAM: hypothetical protein K2H54_034004, partial [Gekko kuhli]
MQAGGAGPSGLGPGTVGTSGALVPAGIAGVAGRGPVPSALPGGLTPAVLDAFWDTPVSRAILAGIEQRLEGSATSSQQDVSSFELFQAEVLHRLDTIENRCAGASSSAVTAVPEESRLVQVDAAVTDGRGAVIAEAAATVSGHTS